MTEKEPLKLQDEMIELKKQLEFYRKKCDQQEQAYQQLLQAFKDFQRHRFGSRSEKFIDADNPQIDLFATQKALLLNKTSSKDPVEDNNAVSIAPHQRRRNVHKRLPAGLPHREVIIPVENKLCGCGEPKATIRYEITELLHYQPPVYEVIVQKREVVVCNNKCSQSMVIAKNPARILPKTNITSSLLAHVIVSKLHDRQPHYHFEKRLKETIGLELRRNKLSRWFIEASRGIQPLINLLKDTILDYDIAAADPTFLQVLREPGREPTKKSYAFCIRGGPANNKSVLYEYNAENHKQFLANWFDGFRGFLQVDAQNIYDDLEKVREITLVCCNAHARRKFEAIAKQTKATDGLSHQALRFYQKIYRLEREAKNLRLTDPAKMMIRQERMLPIFNEFKLWLDEEYPTTLPQSPLGKAFQYTLNHWGALTRFFEDGRLDIDNNLTEQSIKYLVMPRKAFLFAATVDGAKSLCNHLSLIRTAILHNLDPYQYYVKIFDCLPLCKTLADYEALLPWNINMPRITLLKAA